MFNKKRSVVKCEFLAKTQERERKEAQKRIMMVVIRFMVGLFAIIGVFFIVATDVLAKEERIEEIHAKQLEKMIKTRDFVAVFWFSRNCGECDDALEELESIDDDAEKFSVDFVKINDKRLAKSYGIRIFPTLTFFQNGELNVFHGDINDEEEVLEFLTSDNFLIIPDKIENVNADTLATFVAQDSFVTALFYDDSNESTQVINQLETIDDEAEVFKIRFVKIKDKELAEEYSLHSLPSVVYFRNGIPIVFHGDLLDEDEVLEWLIQNLSSADDEDIVESVNEKELEIMVKNIDLLLVLFHDNKKSSKQALESLENIDDDCDRIGVSFVEVNNREIAQHFADIHHYPSLVFFKNEIPFIYQQNDLNDNKKVMSWLISQIQETNIDEIQEKLIQEIIDKKQSNIGILFYSKENIYHETYTEIIHHLDEVMEKEKSIIKIFKSSSNLLLNQWNINYELPTFIRFNNGKPQIYTANLNNYKKLKKFIKI